MTVGQSAHHGSPAPNHVFERSPHTTVADEKTVIRTSQLFATGFADRAARYFFQPQSVAARKMAPYAPSPTSIAKKSEK